MQTDKSSKTIEFNQNPPQFEEDYFSTEFFEKARASWKHFEYYVLGLKKIIGHRPLMLLDVGCAKGFLVEATLLHGMFSYGCDISNYILHKSPKRIRGLLIRASAEYLPFRKSSFDIVTLIALIEHLHRPEQALEQALFTLKKNGFLVITTPVPGGAAHHGDSTHINVKEPKHWISVMKTLGFFVKPFYRFYTFQASRNSLVRNLVRLDAVCYFAGFLSSKKDGIFMLVGLKRNLHLMERFSLICIPIYQMLSKFIPSKIL